MIAVLQCCSKSLGEALHCCDDQTSYADTATGADNLVLWSMFSEAFSARISSAFAFQYKQTRIELNAWRSFCEMCWVCFISNTPCKTEKR